MEGLSPSKLVLRTLFVRCNHYYTPIFTEHYWNRITDRSFAQEVWDIAKDQQLPVRFLLQKLGAQVDALEANLSTRKTWAEDAGISNTTPKPITMLKHHVAYPLLTTLLLDRFLYVCGIFDEDLRMEREAHPPWSLNINTISTTAGVSFTSWDVDRLESQVRLFVSQCQEGLDPRVIEDYLTVVPSISVLHNNHEDPSVSCPSSHQSEANTYSDNDIHIPMGTAVATHSLIRTRAAAPVNALVVSGRHAGLSAFHRVMANCAVIAASAMFLIHVCLS